VSKKAVVKRKDKHTQRRVKQHYNNIKTQ